MDKATLTRQDAQTRAQLVTENHASQTTAEALERIGECLQEAIEQPAKDSALLPPYPLEELAEISSLMAGNWHLSETVDGAIHISYLLKRERVVRIESRYDGCDMSLLTALREEGLKIVSSRVSGVGSDNKAVSLELVPEIPAQLRFCATDDHDLSVWIVNADQLGARECRFASSDVDSAFCAMLQSFVRQGDSAWLGRLVETGKTATWQSIVKTQPESPVPESARIIQFGPREQAQKGSLHLSMGGLEYSVESEAAETTLGRGLDCTMRVEALSVSRQHARLTFDSGDFYLEDVSSNGTFIQQRGKPELFIHKGLRKLSGEGVFSLGSSVLEPDSVLIRYRVESSQ